MATEEEEQRRIEQLRAVEDYRVAILKSVENDDQIGQYAYNENWNKTEAERLRERGRQLDENESVAKERYEELKCEEVTGGFDANGYRHQVISDYVDRKMEEQNAEREKKRAEIAAQMQNSNENSNHL